MIDGKDFSPQRHGGHRDNKSFGLSGVTDKPKTFSLSPTKPEVTPDWIKNKSTLCSPCLPAGRCASVVKFIFRFFLIVSGVNKRIDGPGVRVRVS
jgi:hypothetical protein